LGEISLNSLSNEDEIELRNLIQRHFEETQSAVASAILTNFATEAKNFTKVLPRDYARVMEIQAKALELGHEPDGQEVWTQILEVING
jgi:glutamate synthase (NADPH/NADH) large chain